MVDARGHGALALTDHDSLSGSMEFAQAATSHGLRAIHGAEVTIADAAGESSEAGPRHLTLLVRDARRRDFELSFLWVLALLAVWANLHGAVVLGALLLSPALAHSSGASPRGADEYLRACGFRVLNEGAVS